MAFKVSSKFWRASVRNKILFNAFDLHLYDLFHVVIGI